MVKLLLITLLFFILSCFGCAKMSTGFSKLEGVKYRESKLEYGNGDYYRFKVKGSELSRVGKSQLEKIKILVKKNMREKKVCLGTYEVLEDTLVFFEGGSASIFIHCR